MTRPEPIAIIGMACRFAGASNLDEFWRMLLEGRDGVSEVPADRWKVDDVFDAHPGNAGKVRGRWGGFLQDIDRFDADFFSISPREAPHVDPRQRLMLEVSWEALEDAVADALALAGTDTGVYVSMLTNDYDQLLSRDLSQFQAHTGIGTANSAIANRISYFLDLHGPSLVLDTACSGSLVAIDLACRDLRDGHTSLAIAGGVSVNLLPSGDVFFSQAGALSPEGRCRTFDASAQGMVRGEGAAAIILKPLSRALADGNRVYAVIRGSAVNHGGRSNGIMAPNGRAQQALLREAYRRAGIAPVDVGYLEAHGTGTPVGDPIEIEAVTAVLGEGRDLEFPLVLGSVKSNIGHPEAAAGVAGVIKVSLSLWHGVIPPVVHFQTLNPMIAAPHFPLRILQEAEPWPVSARPRIAGVSGFGFAGTNAHVVIEEAPALPRPPTEPDSPCLLAISAHSDDALRDLAGRYVTFLPGLDADITGPEICRAAATGRAHLDSRLAVPASARPDLLTRLSLFASTGELPEGASTGATTEPGRPRLAFVFSGQCPHWVGMGRELWENEPVFRKALEECAEAHDRFSSRRLMDSLTENIEPADWNDMDVAQPLIVAFQIALAALWRSWGVQPDVVVGQSLGEVAAACVSGAISVDDAMRIVWHRSRLLQTQVGRGGTAVVGLPLIDAQQALAGSDLVAVAGSTGPATSLLSGDPAELRRIVETLEVQGVFCRILENIKVAAHSPQMDGLLPDLAEALDDLQPRPSAIPMLSTVSGTIVPGERLNAAYWTRNLRQPFRFAEAIDSLLEGGFHTFLEISTHPVLGGAIRQSLAQRERDGLVLETLRRDSPERQQIFSSAGALFTHGYPIDWEGFYPGGKRFVPLPTYPWQRRRYWFESEPASTGTSRSAAEHPLLGERVDSPAWPDRHLWELDVRLGRLPYLRDHAVQDTVLLPGAAFVEMAAAAAADIDPEWNRIEHMEFVRALALSDRPARIQVACARQADGTGRIEIFSRPVIDPLEGWTLHATALAVRSSQVPEGQLERARECCRYPMAVDAFYAAMEQRGIQYGPAFRVMRAAWQGEREALGLIELGEQEAREVSAYRIHPSLLDGALQVAAAALPASEGSTYLPSSIGQIQIEAEHPTRLWCHARILPADVSDETELVTNLTLFDDQGRPAGTIKRLGLRRLEGGVTRPRQLLHERRWVPSPREATGIRAEGDWLILASDSGQAESLAALLEVQGGRCTILTARDAEENGWPDNLRALAPVLQKGWRGIICLWPLANARREEKHPDVEAAHLSWSIARLFRAVAEAARPPYSKVWLVTAGAQPTGSDGGVTDLAAASLSGLSRAIRLENPEIWGGIVDLDPGDMEGSLSSFCDDIIAPDQEDQIAYRDGTRLAPRLTEIATSPPGGAVPFRPNATYLITGGLTGIGLETARWMAGQGARRLILLGRTDLPARSEWRGLPEDHPAAGRIKAVRELEALGATVYPVSIDVADRSQLASLFEQLERDQAPPIRGVVHAAGILRDELLLRVDRPDFEAVLRPKTIGAWNLHELTQDMELDFFVLYSSMSALTGQFGQGAYAAGNAFLDALAHRRAALRLPAMSINWGPWRDTGLVARGFAPGDLQLPGVRLISTEDGIADLSQLLAGPRTQVAVVDADWTEVPPQPLLHDLIETTAPPSSGEMPEGQDMLALMAMPEQERQSILTDQIRAEAGRVLRLDPGRISTGRPLTSFGMDSIMAAELRNRLRVSYAVELSLLQIFTASISELTTQVSTLLQTNSDLENALAEIEQLSPEEAGELLAGLSHDG